MGYYTRFEISVQKHKSNKDVNSHEFTDTLVKRLNEISDYMFDYYAGEITLEGKWYDWKDHLKQLSSEYPGMLFEIDGEGEESGDLWKAYVLDGKLQLEKASIVYGDFDESKLV